MAGGGALYKSDTFAARWGTFLLGEDSTLTLSTDDGESSTPLRLSDSAFVDIFVADDWACLMGAADREVVVALRAGPRLFVAGEMTRLATDATPRIGTHAVRFHPLPETRRCLLTWEIGAALIDPDVGIVWSHVHDDPDHRVLSTTESEVELRSLRSTLTIHLADGEVHSSELANPLAVDRATLAEWQRGIGK